MKKLLLSAVALSLLAVAYGQQKRIMVSGFVREASSQEPLYGADIVVGGERAVSGNQGSYSIRLSQGGHSLICSFPGFKADTLGIVVQADTVINITLQPDVIAIDNVIVKGTTGEISGMPFGKTDVNLSQLKVLPLFAGEQDIFKYFQILPGVTGGNEGSSDLNIRGGNHDQTLILLDDIPIYNQNHALGILSTFNGDALARAELYKGNIPAMLGGRLSGVASMVTKEGDKQKHNFVLGTGMLNASFTADGPIKRGKLSYMFSGRSFIPGFLLDTYYLVRNPYSQIGYRFWDVNGKLSWNINPRNTLSWSIYSGSDNLSFKQLSYFNVQHENNASLELSQKNNMGFRWNSLTSSLRLNSMTGKGTFLTTTLYYTAVGNNITTKCDNILPNKHIISSQNKSLLSELGLRSVAQRKIGGSTLNYGLLATWQEVMPMRIIYSETGKDKTDIKYNNLTLYTTSLFADNTSTLGAWELHYGLRVPLYYNTNRFACNIEPRLGASYAINPKHSLHLSYDRNTQPLFSLDERYNSLPFSFWLPYRNTTLMTSDQISAGWKAKPAQEIFVSLEAFYKRMNNLYLVYDEDAVMTDSGGYDVGHGYSFGGELIAQYTARRGLAILSYTQARSRRVAAGQEYMFACDIPWSLNLFGKYNVVTEPGKSHYLSANLNFHAGLPTVLSNEVYPSLPDYAGSWDSLHAVVPNDPRYPNARLYNYFRLDLNYTMERQKRTGRRVWQFSILNVTNHFNPYFVIVDAGNRIKAVNLIPFMPSFSYKRYW